MITRSEFFKKIIDFYLRKNTNAYALLTTLVRSRWLLIYSHLERTSLVNKEFIIWPRRKLFLATKAGNPERATWVGLYFEFCYLNIFSLINIVNKKRICDRSLHFQSQMTKAPRIVQWISRLKQTGFDNFSGRQCCRLCREVVLAPPSLRPLLAS